MSPNPTLNHPSAPRAEETSGLPAGLGAGAGWARQSLWLALAAGLLLAAGPSLPAAALPADEPAPPPAVDEDPEAAENPKHEESFRETWARMMHWRRFHQIGLCAGAEFAYFGRDLSAQAVRWNGGRSAQMRGHRLRTTLSSARFFGRIEGDDRERHGEEAGMRYFLLAADHLRTTWRDGNGGRFALDWQSLRAGFLSGHGGVKSWWLIPTAGIAYPFEFGLAWDHLALQAQGAETRYRDGVRLALGVAHLEGAIWSEVGISLGAKLDFNLGAGLLGDRLYGVAMAEIEPRIGINFVRGREDGCDIAWGGIYLGAKTGGRWLWAAGPHPTQLQNGWALQPNLALQVYF